MKGSAAKKKGRGGGGGGENPFEFKKNRTKFAVMGRKVKGTVVKLAKASAKSDEKRRDTIGVEFEQRGKTGKFIDKRFGERDNLSEPEKNDMRFHHERLRQTRNLFSIDPAEESLTHLGMRLGEPAAGANTLQDDLFFQVGEDDEFGGRGGLLDEQAVQSLHFGGGEGEGGAARKKTKREIMDEIVAKSKQHKAERRQENQEQMELMQQVDAAFKEITPFLTLKKKPETRKKEEGKEEEQVEEEEGGERAAPGRAHEEGYEADEYDQLVTELRATSRDAKAADRMQSKEEEARLRLERLKALEVMRERRMQGVAVGPGEEDGPAAAAKGDGGKKGERLLLEELKKRVAAGKGVADEEDEDEDNEEDEDNADDEEDKEGKKSNRKLKRRLRAKLRGALKKELHDRGDWVIHKRWKRDLLEDEDAAAAAEAESHRTLVDATTGEEFPFVLPVPDSFDAFCALMRGNSAAVCGAVLDRMLHSNDPLLEPANAARLRRLHVFLLGHALRLSGPLSHPAYDWIEMAFGVIRRLVLMLPAAGDASGAGGPLGSHASPWFPYRVLLNVLAGAEPLVPARPGEDAALFEPLLPRPERPGRRRAGAAASSALAARAAYYDEEGFPAAPLCLVLLNLSRLFSASDRLHPVWSPALVHLLSVLATAVPRRAAHLRLLCLLCEGLLPVLADARAFAAEPAAFLASLGALLAAPPDGPPPLLPRHPHWPALALAPPERAELGRLCAAAAGRCAEWLLSLGPAHRPLLQALLEAGAVAQEQREALARRAAALVLPPLRLFEKRMQEVEQVAPKVFLTGDGGYNGRHDPDEERRQAKLLARKLKQEKRGAMRELRRDREFLNTMKREEFAEETAERQQSMKAIRSFLVQGQTEHKRELKDKVKAQQKMKL